MFFLPNLSDSIGTIVDKMHEEISKDIIITETYVGLITGSYMSLLNLSSTKSGMIVSTLKKSDYETNNEARHAINIFF